MEPLTLAACLVQAQERETSHRQTGDFGFRFLLTQTSSYDTSAQSGVPNIFDEGSSYFTELTACFLLNATTPSLFCHSVPQVSAPKLRCRFAAVWGVPRRSAYLSLETLLGADERVSSMLLLRSSLTLLCFVLTMIICTRAKWTHDGDEALWRLNVSGAIRGAAVLMAWKNPLV